MNSIFAVTFWGNDKFKESLRICDRMLLYFDGNEEQEVDEHLISGMVRLKHLILTRLGYKLQAYFFLKRNLDLLLEEDEVSLRMWYQKSKVYLVDTYYVRIAYVFVVTFFLYSMANYYFDFLDFPYTVIVFAVVMMLMVLGRGKKNFVKTILNRIF